MSIEKFGENLELAIIENETRLQEHLSEAIRQSTFYYAVLPNDQNSQALYLVLNRKLFFPSDQLDRLYYSFNPSIETEKFAFKDSIYTKSRFLMIKDYVKYIYNFTMSEGVQTLFIHAFKHTIDKFVQCKITGAFFLENNLLIPLSNRQAEKTLKDADWVIISPNIYENYKALRRLFSDESRFNEKDLHFAYKFESNIQERTEEISENHRFFLFEQVIEDRTESYFVLYGHSEIYQYHFQLDGLKKFRNGLNPHHKTQKEYMLLHRADSQELEMVSLPEHIVQLKNWDEKQLTALKLFFQGKPLIVLNGFVGSGKTEVITTFLANLKDKRAIFLAHDHAIVEFLFKKYRLANPDNLALRIGNQKKAKVSPYHIKSNLEGIRQDILRNLDQRLKTQTKESKQRPIMDDWQKFLGKEEGLEILGKLQFNSANALFCTINGLEYYNKKKWLDDFLPFDYLLVDEASMADLSMVFHTTQFCRSNIIAGDQFLIPPRNPDWKNRSNFLQDIDKIFGENDQQFIVSFENEYRMTKKIFELLNAYVWKNPNARCKSNEGSMFNVGNSSNLLNPDPICFINSDYLGSKSQDKNGVNPWEVKIIKQLLAQFNDKNNWAEGYSNPEKPRVWCTSLSNRQVKYMAHNLPNREYPNLDLEIASVRSFSGDQADVVIWSINLTPVVNKKNEKIVDSIQALLNPEYLYNLITRTKAKLIFIGSAEVLKMVARILQNPTRKNPLSNKMGVLIENLITPRWSIIIEP